MKTLAQLLSIDIENVDNFSTRRVSLIVSALFISDDFVFRLGGEEFSGVLISNDYDKTQKWVMSLTKTIEDLKIEHLKSDVSKYVTVNISISAYKAL